MHAVVVSSDALTVVIEVGDERPPSIIRLETADATLSTVGVPALEILTADGGHASPVNLLSRTRAGSRLRYVGHEVTDDSDSVRMIMLLSGPDGLDARWQLRLRPGVAALTSSVTVINSGDRDVVLLQAASLCCAVSGRSPGGEVSAVDLDVITGTNDWVGENRWRRAPLRDQVADLSSRDHRVAQKGGLVARSLGSWSTGRDLPVGVLAADRAAISLAWQIEHNGGWRWEISADDELVALAASGPTDVDHQWSAVLAPGESFTTVPVTLTLGSDWEAAIAALTDHRRAARCAHPDNVHQTLIYNDYMNTLLGDPSTEKLLPLIAAAADVGAEVFCIDAGWYDDGSDWWPSVGAWQPSTTRFPGGLELVTDAILEHGMVPGLWLEPEVVGVRSPVADRLPYDAFLQRHGRRVIEAERYHLDLRHPAARDHLDETVDRLINDFGVGMFKLDYNINPGPGTDRNTASPGAGLLGHQRALLDWYESVYARHPQLIIENCSSGAMRSDFATLSRLNLQSTSDQQDLVAYAPIAAAAPMIMLPEQAGSWAYPAAGMTLEETAMTLQAGLLGRLYLSGYLHQLTDPQQALVREAVAAHRELRAEILTARPRWPLGLPGWNDPQLALALESPNSTLLTVWHRGRGPATIRLPLPAARTRLEPVFPTSLGGWRAELDGSVLELLIPVPGPAARTYRLSS